MEEVAADAAAARHLAAARDRDLADGVKVDDNRSAISALGEQTAAGLEETRKGFAEIRGKLDQAAAGQQHIADMLTTLISAQGDQGDQ